MRPQTRYVRAAATLARTSRWRSFPVRGLRRRPTPATQFAAPVAADGRDPLPGFCSSDATAGHKDNGRRIHTATTVLGLVRGMGGLVCGDAYYAGYAAATPCASFLKSYGTCLYLRFAPWLSARAEQRKEGDNSQSSHRCSPWMSPVRVSSPLPHTSQGGKRNGSYSVLSQPGVSSGPKRGLTVAAVQALAGRVHRVRLATAAGADQLLVVGAHCCCGWCLRAAEESWREWKQ